MDINSTLYNSGIPSSTDEGRCNESLEGYDSQETRQQGDMDERNERNSFCEKKEILFSDFIGLVGSKPTFCIKPAKPVRLESDIPSWRYAPDDSDIFKNHCESAQNEIKTPFILVLRDLVEKNRIQCKGNVYKPKDEDMDHLDVYVRNLPKIQPIMFNFWENQVVFDEISENLIRETTTAFSDITRVSNDKLCQDWCENIIWDGEDVSAKDRFGSLYPDSPLTEVDPFLTLEHVNVDHLLEKLQRTEKAMSNRMKMMRKKLEEKQNKLTTQFASCFTHRIPDRFNLSNDKYYENKRPKYIPIGVSNGKVEIQHSAPAVGLSRVYYKTCLSKTELRNLHRSFFLFPLNEKIDVCPPKSMPSQSSQVEENYGVPRALKELTLSDNTDILLLEYSEENPPVMMKEGMCTTIYNYYRKKGPKDSYKPSDKYGITQILEHSSPSPFFGFGDVKPGKMLPVVQNALFRAPLFRHSPREGVGHLLIRSTVRGEKTYTVKKVSTVYLVGQTLPIVEVYGPQSRKANTYCKHRLEVALYKLFQKKQNKGKRINVKKILGMFPQFPETVIRKWLKDIANYVRVNKDGGLLVPSQNMPNLTEEDLHCMMTPEMVCRYESMLASKQILQDAGLLSSFMEEDSEDSGNRFDSKLSDEVKIAPWNTTRNFILAAQGKALLELEGFGDPTGRGEGFNFMRVPLKPTMGRRMSTEVTSSMGKFSTVQQQQIYKQKIAKIWDAQCESLSSTDGIPKEEYNKLRTEERSADSVASRTHSHYCKDMTDKVTEKHHQEPSLWNKSNVNSPDIFTNKKLTIRRYIYDSNQNIVEETEYVTDPRVVSLYLRQKTVIEEHEKKMEIENKLKRKKTPEDLEGTDASSRTNAFKRVKCGNCGEYGHMKTNKNCPMFKGMTGKSQMTESDQHKQTGSRQEVKITIPSVLVKEAESKTREKIEKQLLKENVEATNTVLAELSKELRHVWMDIIKTPNSFPFHKPVSTKIAPDYYEVIKDPMDLSSVKKKINRRDYKTAQSFLDDISLVYTNCLKYNGEEHYLTRISREIWNTAEKMMKERQNVFSSLEELLKQA